MLTDRKATRTRADPLDVIIIGAGASGLACAAALKARGCKVVLLERANSVGASWRGRYDRLRLNTSRWFSRIARYEYPCHTPLFPARDQVAAYLEAFARSRGLDVRFGVRAQRIARATETWLVCSDRGAFRAAHVVVATGYFREPVLPDWPGRDRFGGPLLHSSQYRNADPFVGRDVLVVGAGSSGMEIAYDLVRGGARTVRLSIRTPPNILLRELGGVPSDPLGLLLIHVPAAIADRFVAIMRRLVLGDLSSVGLPAPKEGVFHRVKRTGAGPSIVDREVIDAFRAREIEVVPQLRELDTHTATFGPPNASSRVAIDAIIAATGFRPGLESLVGHLGVLDARGEPRVRNGDEAVTGLRFIGFEPVPALFFDVTKKARRIARSIAHERQRRTRSLPCESSSALRRF